MLLTASLLASAPALGALLLQVPNRTSIVRPPADTARAIPWDEFTNGHFDLGKVLPRPVATDLLKGKKTVPDLAVLLRHVATKRFPEDEYHAYEEWLRSFGDIMRELGKHRGNRIETERAIKSMQRKWPQIWNEIGPFVAQFTQADELYGLKWRPKKDLDRDGIYIADSWRLNPQLDRSRYWNNLDCDTDVYQGAAFVYSDYATLRSTALDYERYPEDVDRKLEWVHARRDKVFRAIAGDASWFGHEIAFEGDLPFPFGTTICEMHVLDRLEEDGTPVTDYYAVGEDLYWFAGRDTYLQVRDSAGRLVGTLLVSQVGFDIDGVPDGDSDREKLLRASIGNWKRVAEPLFAAKGGKFEAVGERLPVVPLTGFE